eukprot:GHVR01118134.1.p1 GENE.GHVR01118134.1~~GHVR01118134.1.p1  ORF type:complete len:339 (+),score=45.67 GHVR01118134.1:28-1044(+)
MNPFVLLLLLTYLTISFGNDKDNNRWGLLEASELKEKYVLQKLLGVGNSADVYLIKEKNGKERQFALKFRYESNLQYGFANKEQKALEFVTNGNIPFTDRLIESYHCPTDMEIEEGTQKYFDGLLLQEMNGDEKMMYYLTSGYYPILLLSLDQIEVRQPMCFLLEYVSGGSLEDKHEKFMQINSEKEREKDTMEEQREYIESLRRWTMQILASFHFIHQGKYVKRSNKGPNFLIDGSNNVVVIDFGRSSSRDFNDIVADKESTEVFNLLLAHCDTETNFINNLSDKNRKFFFSMEKLNNISLDLCEKYWKQLNKEKKKKKKKKSKLCYFIFKKKIVYV